MYEKIFTDTLCTNFVYTVIYMNIVNIP
jgi:hypothetical protein